jgi:hypothetical protein
MARTTIWKGTVEEALALVHALQVNCACGVERGRIVRACAPHQMMAFDQRAIDGLLFMRHIAPRLLAEEFDPINFGQPAGW